VQHDEVWRTWQSGYEADMSPAPLIGAVQARLAARSRWHVEELLGVLRNVIRNEGLSAIVVEQHARKVLKITDHALILDRGMEVHGGSSSALIADPSTLERYGGVAGGTPRSEAPGR
jgi:hypothetical protein